MKLLECPRGRRTPRARAPPIQASLTELSGCKNSSSGSIAASTYQGSSYHASRNNEKMSELSLSRCITSWNRKHMLGSMEAGAIGFESDAQAAQFHSCDNGENERHFNDRASTHFTAGPSPLSPDSSVLLATGSSDAWLAVGSLVWARIAHQEWWPAEIVDEKVVSEQIRSEHVGHVLVQLYGSYKYEWVDPVKEVSHFDYCFEERSKNSLPGFQDALQQALCTQVHVGPQKWPADCSSELKSSIKHEQPNGTSSSSEFQDECADEGRGRRKRKLKIHFDELTAQNKSPRKARRLKIMRHLGLIAPAGSPFSF